MDVLACNPELFWPCASELARFQSSCLILLSPTMSVPLVQMQDDPPNDEIVEARNREPYIAVSHWCLVDRTLAGTLQTVDGQNPA